MVSTTTYPTLQKNYYDNYRKDLKAELELKSMMEVPELKKIVVNVGAGEAVSNPKIIDGIVENLKLITGQAPIKTKSRKAIAGFKLREDQVIGVKVTLRGKRMYDFLGRLINAALPRVRDFNGISRKGFDQGGNFTMGIKEHIIFPEIHFDNVDKIHGMNISMVFRTNKAEHSIKLMEKFNFPFRKK